MGESTPVTEAKIAGCCLPDCWLAGNCLASKSATASFAGCEVVTNGIVSLWSPQLPAAANRIPSCHNPTEPIPHSLCLLPHSLVVH